MLKISALSYITIGQYLQQITCNLKKAEADDPPAIGPQDIAFIKRLLLLLQKESDNMGLPVSSPLLAELAGELSHAGGGNAPYLHGKISMLVKTISQELTQLFLHIPSDRSQYYDWAIALNENIFNSFPIASIELSHAGKCFAVGEYTACIFHSMRAAEIGLRALAYDRRIKFKKIAPLELKQWDEILEGLEKEEQQIQTYKKTKTREAQFEFYHGAMVELRAFKNMYRNRVMHARKIYDYEQAHIALFHVANFIKILSQKISETKRTPKVWRKV
jgi:hypothetical protein